MGELSEVYIDEATAYEDLYSNKKKVIGDNKQGKKPFSIKNIAAKENLKYKSILKIRQSYRGRCILFL